MSDIFIWISFVGPPLFVILVTAYVFWPSNRKRFHDAKQVIFYDDEIHELSRKHQQQQGKLKA